MTAANGTTGQVGSAGAGGKDIGKMTEEQQQCEDRGYHRAPALELRCVWCGTTLTPEQVIEAERRKMEKMEAYPKR
jgi:hypothetical protein